MGIGVVVSGPITDLPAIEGSGTMPSTPTSGSPYLYMPATSGVDAPGAPSSMPAFLEKGLGCLEEYARREPWAFAGWVFGVGFVLGWKLKPW